MKLLRISSNKAEYSCDGTSFKDIYDISKEDILVLMERIIESDDIELDEPNNEILVPAQKIIYERLYSKLKEIVDKKPELQRNIDLVFKDAMDKYSAS